MISLYNLYYNMPFYISFRETSGFNNTLYGFFQFLYFIVLFAIIIFLAYVFTKYIAKKGIGTKNNKNIKVVESVPLGMDKSLFLIKVGKQYFLIGSSQKNLTLISEVKLESLDITECNNVDVNSSDKFDEYLNHYKEIDNISEGLKYNNITDSLRKLKIMVRGNKSDEK